MFAMNHDRGHDNKYQNTEKGDEKQTNSYVAKFYRVENYVRGIYAARVTGEVSVYSFSPTCYFFFFFLVHFLNYLYSSSLLLLPPSPQVLLGKHQQSFYLSSFSAFYKVISGEEKKKGGKEQMLTYPYPLQQPNVMLFAIEEISIVTYIHP